jgi:hypothetical protein
MSRLCPIVCAAGPSFSSPDDAGGFFAGGARVRRTYEPQPEWNRIEADPLFGSARPSYIVPVVKQPTKIDRSVRTASKSRPMPVACTRTSIDARLQHPTRTA